MVGEISWSEPKFTFWTKSHIEMTIKSFITLFPAGFLIVLRPNLKTSSSSGHFKGLKVLKHPAGNKDIKDFRTYFHSQNWARPLDIDMVSSDTSGVRIQPEENIFSFKSLHSVGIFEHG